MAQFKIKNIERFPIRLWTPQRANILLYPGQSWPKLPQEWLAEAEKPYYQQYAKRNIIAIIEDKPVEEQKPQVKKPVVKPAAPKPIIEEPKKEKAPAPVETPAPKEEPVKVKKPKKEKGSKKK